jgi:hypothetical protein
VKDQTMMKMVESGHPAFAYHLDEYEDNHGGGSFELLRDDRLEMIDRTIYVHRRGQSWECDELAWTASSISDGSQFAVETHDAAEDTYDDFFLELLEDGLPDVILPIQNDYDTPKHSFCRERDLPDTEGNNNYNMRDTTARIEDPQPWYSNVIIPTSKMNTVFYAQLSFDPEPKALMMELEIHLPSVNAVDKRRSTFDNDIWYHRIDDPRRTTCLHHHLHTTNRIAKRSNDGLMMIKHTSLPVPEQLSQSRNKDGNIETRRFPTYSNEPLGFTHGGPQIVWPDESGMNVPLLGGSGCNTSGSAIVRKSRNCADSMRKLALTSRSCVSLLQVADSKWRAGHRAIKQERKLAHHSEKLAYSLLQNH